jgi:hypothetical protein
MNLYANLGSGIGTNEATALSARLAAWHDAMVAHERRLRTDPAAGRCGDECPHAEASGLWHDAVETFGRRARELTFLRSRADAAIDGIDRTEQDDRRARLSFDGSPAPAG